MRTCGKRSKVSVWMVVLLGLAAVGFSASPAAARQLIVPRQKCYLLIAPSELSLLWNGDQGEGGRGRGEIYLSIFTFWAADVEAENPQHAELGPLGGDSEFPSGTINNCNMPGVSIKPATVFNGAFKKSLYFNYANCPVPDEVIMSVNVWDSDSNTEIKEYTDAIADAVEESGSTELQILVGLFAIILDILTESADDYIARCQLCAVSFPNPCGPPFIVDRELDLKFIASQLWQDVNAEAEDGTPFGDCGVTPPADLGTFKMRIVGGPMATFCSVDVVDNAQHSTDLALVDLGQTDDATVSAVMKLGDQLPEGPVAVTYSFYVDADNDLATGSPLDPSVGAEYALQLDLSAGPDPVSRLLVYNEGFGGFEEVPGGIYDTAISIDRLMIILSAELSTLGTPAGPIAGWGVVESEGDVASVLPADPQIEALGIPLVYDYSGVPPMVVSADPPPGSVDADRSSAISARFNKAMDRPLAEAAVDVLPPVAGTFSWQGNQLALAPSEPLAPATTYVVTVAATATDRTGVALDGNHDLVEGDPFSWSFTTDPLDLHSTDADGAPKGQFIEGDEIFATGSDFGGGDSVDLYVVTHSRSELVDGTFLEDMTDNGADVVVVNPEGTLPVAPLGVVEVEGEYNIVADLNGSGVYESLIDRIDKTGIGLSVLQPCPGDIDGDRKVGVLDFLALLAAWGPNPGHPADLDGSGSVGITDFLIMLGTWGVCP